MVKYNLKKVNKAEIVIDKETVLENVDVRYSIKIPFSNRKNGLSVGIILMNPSEADKDASDGTINKLINFFYTYQINDDPIKDISICNVSPVYASNSTKALEKIRLLYKMNILESIQKLNTIKIDKTMKDKDLIVLGWGKPNVKTIPNVLYYKEVLSVIDLLSTLYKDDLYVFNIKNSISTFTEHGDPRHPARGVTLNGLIKIDVSELFSLY